MRNVTKILAMFPNQQHVSIENEPYMRLVIERIGTGPRGCPLISVAHYGEQNGDAMRDPEMTFEIGGGFHPVSFQNDYMGIYQEAVFQNEQGQVSIRPRLVKDLRSFAAQWNRNLGEQGFVDAARKIILAN